MRVWLLPIAWALVAAAWACNGSNSSAAPSPATPAAQETASQGEATAAELAKAASERRAERERMVAEQIEARGVSDPRVLGAMRRVPRHLFVPESEQSRAYGDYPLSIGHDQTISQPYIVGLMSELADVEEGDRVLEVGTGSGYQAAVLAEMGAEVYSIEIVEPLAKRSRAVLRRLRYDRVHVRTGDGYAGWPDEAPFDAVVITAAPPKIPEPLKKQLAISGKLVVPVGVRYQNLIVLTRTADGFQRRNVIPVRFVPMTGKAQQ